MAIPYDYVIVGCGMYGAVFARCVATHGKHCLIIDRRTHIGGNCYTTTKDGIIVHEYGAHIFHTNNESIWRFMQRFSEFNSYVHHVKVRYKDRIFSFPINLLTLHQVWGVTTPEEAVNYLRAERLNIQNAQNLEEWSLSQIGPELYEIFIRGYTQKQWGCEPKALPPEIIKRIPIRASYCDQYFDDRFQGIPTAGYTDLFNRLLDHPLIEVKLGADYTDDRQACTRIAKQLVYTGKLDEFFDYKYGDLDYRSLRFEHKAVPGDFQGIAVMNYTHLDVPFTRIIEHKYFDPQKPRTASIITHEYPTEYTRGKEAYYPIRNQRNAKLYEQYAADGRSSGVVFGGRLGTYQYYDMHQVVGQAMTDANKSLGCAIQATGCVA